LLEKTSISISVSGAISQPGIIFIDLKLGSQDSTFTFTSFETHTSLSSASKTAAFIVFSQSCSSQTSFSKTQSTLLVVVTCLLLFIVIFT